MVVLCSAVTEKRNKYITLVNMRIRNSAKYMRIFTYWMDVTKCLKLQRHELSLLALLLQFRLKKKIKIEIRGHLDILVFISFFLWSRYNGKDDT